MVDEIEASFVAQKFATRDTFQWVRPNQNPARAPHLTAINAQLSQSDRSFRLQEIACGRLQ